MTYAFDSTGRNPNNLIIGESKTISLKPGSTNLFIIPDNGPYFADSLVIKHLSTNGESRILTEGVDYKNSFQFLDGSRKINAAIYAGISFLDLTMTGSVIYNYQTIGSSYSGTGTLIDSLENSITIDPLFTTWDSQLTVPEVPVVDYPWSTVNVDEIKKVVESLEKVGLVTQLRPRLLQTPAQSVFIPSPHEIGLGNVPNYPAATQQQAREGTSNNALMTPATTSVAVREELMRQLSDLGYLVPVPYEGGIYVTNSKFTIEYENETYVINNENLPYTTSGVWAVDKPKFQLFQHSRKENWKRTYITVNGDEPTLSVLGKVFNVSVEHDSRILPQLTLNDVIFLVFDVDYKLNNDNLYLRYPVASGDKLVLYTKKSATAVARDKIINKLIQVTGDTNIFDIGDLNVDKDNLRITLNDFRILNEQVGDYTLINNTLTVFYPLAAGDIIEIENIDSAPIIGKMALRDWAMG